MKVWHFSVWLFALALPTIARAEPMFTHVDVFTSGTEGYHTFRIPAIITAPDGSLIAIAEGRKEDRRDPGGGDIDLVYKRSTDAGTTWSPLKVLDDPGVGWTASNPTPVVDRQTRRIYGGFSAYSDLSILNDKTVGLLWERGVSSGYQFITFTRFNLEFLEPKTTTFPVSLK